MRNYSIRNTKKKNAGHELDMYAEFMLKKQNHFYIIGSENEVIGFYNKTGRYFKEEGYQLLGFWHKDVQNQNGGGDSVHLVPIVEEAIIYADKQAVIICTARERKEYDDLKNSFAEKGFIENQTFFQGEVFSMIYDVYIRDVIRIDRVEVFLTSCCTLKCEKCISYIPYFKNVYHTSLAQLKSDADVLFKNVDYIYKLKLLGGEGFLYPYLIEYIDYVYENYGEKIGTIRIGTNGTIFPKIEILEMCKRDHVTIDISDYRVAVPDRCKLEEVKKYCLDNGVAVDIKRTGEQWLDMGFPDNKPEFEGEKQIQRHFHKCAMFCRQFAKGKLYFCCSNFAAVAAGLFPDSENDYFDFNKQFSKKELLEFELGYSELGHTTFCGVCGGCSEEANSRRVEVAKQIKWEGKNENIYADRFSRI